MPSAYRFAKLDRLLNCIYTSDLIVPVEVLVSPMEDDAASLEIIKRYPVDRVVRRPVYCYPGGSVIGWNELSRLARGEWLVMFSDDLVPERDWLIEAWKGVEQLGWYGLVGLNDLHTDGNKWCTHFMVHRQFLIDHCGGVLFPSAYKSWWFDVELCEIAQEQGAYFYASKAIAEHRHYDWDKSLMDKTYADSIPLHEIDHEVYRQRKAAGWPHTDAPVFVKETV